MTEENLHQKFTNLQQQLALQHDELMNKLDAVLTALGAPPPTAVVTLADVLQELQSMNSRVFSLRNAVGIIPTDAGISLLAQVASLVTRITAVESATVATATALGIPTGDATTTALGRLAAIESCVCLLAGQVPTDPGTSECESPFTSGYTWELVLTSEGGGEFGVGVVLHVAAFAQPLPPGLVEGTIYALTPPSGTVSELAPTGTWDGWRVYVKSSASTYGDSITPGVRHPTNEWRDLTGTGTNIFSVYRPDDITVYLCGPDNGGNGGNGGPLVECTEASSQNVSVDPNNGVPIRQMAIIPGWPDVRNYLIVNPTFTAYFDPPCIHYGDLAGYQVNCISGRVRIVYRIEGVESTQGTEITTGGSYTLPAGCNVVDFDDFVAPDTPGTGAFVMELCPPQEV